MAGQDTVAALAGPGVPEDPWVQAIDAAELAEAETRYRNQLAREMAGDAYERGQVDGYLRAIADVKAIQHGFVRDAELEARRWGPGGRGHFGDPRPGDFPGRAGRREPEPELEAEIT
jgi:hypothetical protein